MSGRGSAAASHHTNSRHCAASRGGAVVTVVRMDDKVNLAEKVGLLDKPYSPGIVGYLNDFKLQVVKVEGRFVWHSHEDTDDFFFVVLGRLTIHLCDRDMS